jgi:hypothetical protein
MTLIAALAGGAAAAAEGAPRWSCSGSAGGVSHHIEVHADRLVVIQSSPTARYAPLTFTIVETPFAATVDKPRFECAASEKDGTSVTIKVFADRAQILRSSPTARFAGIQYRLTRR